jgi:hypothetical protein
MMELFSEVGVNEDRVMGISAVIGVTRCGTEHELVHVVDIFSLVVHGSEKRDGCWTVVSWVARVLLRVSDRVAYSGVLSSS